MSTSQLQTDLQSDIETFKHLRLDILPAKTFYKDILKTWCFVYLCLVSCLFAACLFAHSINAWPNEPSQEIDDHEWSMPILLELNPGVTKEALRIKEQKRLQANNRIREMERAYHQVVVFKMILGVLFASLLIMFFLTAYIKMYVVFKNQICEHLKTGDYLKKKIWLAYAVFISSFLLFSLFFVSLLEQDVVFFAAIPTMICTGFASLYLIDMEFTRIGISPLTSAISDYFERDKTLVGNGR